MDSRQDVESGTEFQPSKPRSEPLTTSGHQVGKKVSPADFAPESHIEILPAGSAPKDRTFAPNPTNEVPGQADNELTQRSHGKESTYVSAESTLLGATSADVHAGYGHPGQGQTSSEVRHDGQHTNKKAGTGLEGVGGHGSSGVNERADATQRGLERDDAQQGQRGDMGLLGAEDRLPETADSLAAERS